MKRLLLILVMCFAITGCSTLLTAAVSAIKPGGGISADAQIGKENTKQVVAKQDIETTTQTVKVSDIGASAKVTTNTTKEAVGVTADTVAKAIATSVKADTSVSVTTAAEAIKNIDTSEQFQKVELGSNSTVNLTQQSNLPIWIILFAFLGWVLPTPVAMFEYATLKFNDNKGIK